MINFYVFAFKVMMTYWIRFKKRSIIFLQNAAFNKTKYLKINKIKKA